MTSEIKLDENLQEAVRKVWWARYGCDEASPDHLDYELELNEIVYWFLYDFLAEANRNKMYDPEVIKELASALNKYEDSID